MAEQNAASGKYQSAYKFNGKEQDAETGNYYYGARYYDPKVSVWLSVDPLAHTSPNFTPYHFVSNNPVNRVDPNGLKDILVGEDGSYKGTQNDNFWHNLWYGTRGSLIDSEGNEKLKFNFADPENDVQDIKDGNFSGAVVVSDKEIQGYLEKSGVYSKDAQEDPASYALGESTWGDDERGSGKMDYSYTAEYEGVELVYQDKLFITKTGDGYYGHNNLNFGNFLWGAGMNALGVNYRMATFGAHANNHKTHGGFDSGDDQISIGQGYGWYNPRNRKSFQWLRNIGE